MQEAFYNNKPKYKLTQYQYLFNNSNMKTNYKTLKELKEAIDSGKIDGKKLQILLDNDDTSYYYDNGSGGIKIEVESAGSGYYDYHELYELSFPLSMVEEC